MKPANETTIIPANNYDNTRLATPDYDENYEENWDEDYDGEYDGEYENENENEYYEPMAGRETAQTHSESRESPEGMPVPVIAPGQFSIMAAEAE